MKIHPQASQSQATLRLVLPTQLTPKLRRGLLANLEVFVNVGDSLADLQKVVGFWPFLSELTEKKDGRKFLDELRPMLLSYRDYLRDVWLGRDEPESAPKLMVLLGLETPEFAGDQKKSVASVMMGQSVHADSLHDLFVNRPWARLSPNWKTGEFEFRALSPFNAAIYLLFTESWRARVCVRCGKYFIAKKPPQLYCSVQCHREAKRKRDLDRWRKVGSRRRKARAKTRRKKGGK